MPRNMPAASPSGTRPKLMRSPVSTTASTCSSSMIVRIKGYWLAPWMSETSRKRADTRRGRGRWGRTSPAAPGTARAGCAGRASPARRAPRRRRAARRCAAPCRARLSSTARRTGPAGRSAPCWPSADHETSTRAAADQGQVQRALAAVGAVLVHRDGQADGDDEGPQRRSASPTPMAASRIACR